MTTTTLTKQRADELKNYAREINELENEILQRKTRVLDEVRQFDCRVIEIGQKLIQAKLRCPKDFWQDWLRANCTVSPRMAQQYMRIAADPKRVSGAASIRQALALLAEGEAEPASDEKPQRELLPYLEALGRIHKFCGYVAKHPLKDWPQEGKDKAREDLEPIARELWPSQFA
jgi:hypothetical protein